MHRQWLKLLTGWLGFQCLDSGRYLGSFVVTDLILYVDAVVFCFLLMNVYLYALLFSSQNLGTS